MGPNYLTFHHLYSFWKYTVNFARRWLVKRWCGEYTTKIVRNFRVYVPVRHLVMAIRWVTIWTLCGLPVDGYTRIPCSRYKKGYPVMKILDSQLSNPYS